MPLGDRLGEGGMGEVWKAWDSSLSRWIAIKILKNLGAQDVSRFHREAQAAGHLNHPNVAVVHEVGEAEGRPFIALQYVDGQTLSRILDTDPRGLV